MTYVNFARANSLCNSMGAGGCGSPTPEYSHNIPTLSVSESSMKCSADMLTLPCFNQEPTVMRETPTLLASADRLRPDTIKQSFKRAPNCVMADLLSFVKRESSTFKERVKGITEKEREV